MFLCICYNSSEVQLFFCSDRCITWKFSTTSPGNENLLRYFRAVEKMPFYFLITSFMSSRKISLISFVTRLHDLANTIDQISEIRSPGDLAANEKAPPHYMIPNQLENLLPSHHRSTHHQSQHPKR